MQGPRSGSEAPGEDLGSTNRPTRLHPVPYGSRAGPDRMLQAAVFLCGLSVMGIEMAASRLLAPYFGTSLFIWTNLIGTIMIALAAGYSLGGRIADRHPRPGVLYRIILAAGVFVAAIPYLTQPVMALSVKALELRQAGVVMGSMAATVALFVVPILLLGMVSPFAIRLASQGEDRLGKTAGGLYALSTVGSIVGTFLPALVTIPLLGTRKTILAFAAILILVGLTGLARRAAAAAPVLALIVALAPFGPIRSAGALPPKTTCLAETESLYHYIQVLEKDGRRMLVLNEGQAVHSIHETRDSAWGPMVGSVWDSMNALPILLDRKPGSRLDVLVVGLAAGTVSKQLGHFFGPHFDLHVDGVEIDGDIVEMGRKYFDMNDPFLDVHVMDGRLFIAGSKKKWDLILGDAYRQPYIPFHLATKEYFELVKEHLKPGGLMSINCGSRSADGPVLKRLLSTVNAVFGSPTILEVQNPASANFNNYVVIAGDTPIEPGKLDPHTPGLCRTVFLRTQNAFFAQLMSRRIADLHPATIDPEFPVLDDDCAPVEVLTDWMIFQLATGKP